MNKFVLAGLMSLSASAFAQTCYVDLKYTPNNQTVQTYVGYGACADAMKECRKAIRFDYSNHPQYPNNALDCVKSTGYTPVPTPNTGYPHNVIVGEAVFNTSNSRYATVIGIDASGRYVIRYNDNGLTGSGWTRSDLAPLRGCDGDICVNDEIFNTSNSRYARVVGLQLGNKFVIKYNDNGLTGSGWTRNDIAPLKGCAVDICVGEEVFNTSNSRYAVVTGLQAGGKFVIRYRDNNLSGSGWTRNDLAILKGCSGDFCVGDKTFNVSNSRYAVIAGIQASGKYVIRYDDNGLTGSGWDRYDLGLLKGCMGNLCVGSKVFNRSNNRTARVKGFHAGNKVIIRYDDNGLTGSGWTLYDLVVVQ